MKLYPLPNVDPAKNDGYNWTELGTVEQPMTQFMTRVDYSISENTKLYTRYNLQRETQPFKYGLWWDSSQVPLPSRIVAPNASDSISVNLSHVFNPTLTNEFTFGYTFIDFPNKWEDPSKVSKSAIGYPYKGLYKDDKFDQIPAITDWGSGVADLYEVGGFDPILFATKHLASFGDNVMKVMSTHTIKAGFYQEFVINKQPNSDLSNGRIIPATWAAKDTGNSYANLLMGVSAEYYESTLNLINNESYNVIEGFVQDSWKATPKLTVEYGMRLSHLGPWSGRNGAAAAIWDSDALQQQPGRSDQVYRRGRPLHRSECATFRKRKSGLVLRASGRLCLFFVQEHGYPRRVRDVQLPRCSASRGVDQPAQDLEDQHLQLHDR